MEQELKDKIERALKLACEPQESECLLEPSGSDHIGGQVISDKFDGLTPSQRQDLIWGFLDEALSPYERTQISFILTATSGELSALRDTA
jgi:stress-induced morphogen